MILFLLKKLVLRKKPVSLVSVRKKNTPFINIVMTDIREHGVAQKAISFFSLIEKCISEERKVNLVVPVLSGDASNAKNIYMKIFSRYLDNEMFELFIVQRPTAILRYFILAVPWFVFFCRYQGGELVNRLNTSYLMALQFYRMLFFYRVYDQFPCQNWIGLTGNVELTSFMAREAEIKRGCAISAIQFGMASEEQMHFKDYCVDSFFVYDALSETVFNGLGVAARKIIISGSPEFEYLANNLEGFNNFGKKHSDKINILLIDQPVGERNEYSATYLRCVRDMLLEVAKMSGVNVSVRSHPRGSAFDGDYFFRRSENENAYQQILEADIVIGFFSNLCDLAIIADKVTFCLGAARVLSKQKVCSMSALGAHVIDEIGEAKERLHEYLLDKSLFQEQDKRRAFGFLNASKVIYSELDAM